MISENLLKEINDAYSRLEARMTAAVSVLKLSKLEVITNRSPASGFVTLTPFR